MALSPQLLVSFSHIRRSLSKYLLTPYLVPGDLLETNIDMTVVQGEG